MEARTVSVVWNGMQVEAADPARIASWVPELPERVVRRTERAAGAIERLGDRTLGVAEVAARLLLRSEGLASSAIEGLRASAADVALAQASGGSRPDGATAACVADNLAVVDQSLATPAPLTANDLLGWHRRLMHHSPTIAEGHVGAYQSGLTLYRQGLIHTWVEWFADAVLAAAEDSAAVLIQIAEVREAWRTAVADLRADSAARRLIEVLPSNPVVSSAMAAGLIGVSDEAARLAIDTLVTRGILAEAGRFSTSPGRPRRWWAANGVLDLLGPPR